MSNKAQKWFAVAIASGVQRLYVLSLDGTPAAKTIELTTATWIDVLWPTRAWCAELDETRIAEAFRQLALHSDRWPVPKQLLLRLPARVEPLKLTAPTNSKSEIAKAAIMEMKQRVGL
ncbi:hypothetical protein SAMN05216302_102149 [Nitrosomonas aestuarii]|uniref:Uncharacterized protein n=1 Tax=Nitrosomonas aestuarii TaxID=52441 RepID=A0A1I4DK96_9PROT|nr:hypothetical protein [Nitrosomonas aestuarii]SFK92867.1 hypothetical protein SAMN05216302_102149 [Nitrosomonas aestuarii]